VRRAIAAAWALAAVAAAGCASVATPADAPALACLPPGLAAEDLAGQPTVQASLVRLQTERGRPVAGLVEYLRSPVGARHVIALLWARGALVYHDPHPERADEPGWIDRGRVAADGVTLRETPGPCAWQRRGQQTVRP
jgi:hypothetical protein